MNLEKHRIHGHIQYLKHIPSVTPMRGKRQGNTAMTAERQSDKRLLWQVYWYSLRHDTQFGYDDTFVLNALTALDGSRNALADW